MAMPKCTMPETIDPSSQSLAVTTVLDQSQDSHIDQLQRAAIGPVNADYYRPILARFETYDRGSPSWNWAASLCTLNWMVFRGMWMPALAYLGGLMLAIAALFAVTRLAAPMAASVEWGLWAALATLAFLVPGFFGNTWLFGHYRLRLAHALSATPTVHDACQLLGQQASSRWRLVLLVAANIVLAISVAAAGHWPSKPSRESARVDHGEVLVEALPPALPTSQPTADPTDSATPQVSASAPVESASDVMSTVVEYAFPALPAPAAASSTPAGAAEASATTSTTPTPLPAAPLSTAPARAQAAADAGIRHAAIAARSRKAHQERTAPVAEATAPTAQDTAPLPAPAPARAAASITTAPVGRYLINVGLFAQQDNARRAFDRLRADGLPATTQNLQRGNNTLTRVRVGPFATRTQADAAAQRIRALQLDAVVIQP